MNELELKQALDSIQENALKAIDNAKSEWKQHAEKLASQGANVADVQTMLERALKRLDNVEAEWTRRPEAGHETKTLGELFTSDNDIATWAKRPAHKGGIRWNVPGGTFFPEDAGIHPEFKTTISSSAVGSSTPGILVPERIPGIVKPGVRRLRVRDLMPRLTTNNNAVEWVKENVFTNAASPTAETISKPESALTFTIDSATVRTLAAWIPAARQVLDDFQQLQAFVNQRLIEGLKDVEDYELVAGDGTGQHLSGLSTEAAAYDTARNVSGDTYIDKINHAASQIEDVLHEADGIILHPRDWRAIQLVKEESGGSNTGAYLLGGPAGTADPVLWGLPVATTTAVTRGTFYVGAFRRYCTIYDRMEARIDISTEHADYFIRNMVAIRAEERLTFTVGRSDSVVYGSF